MTEQNKLNPEETAFSEAANADAALRAKLDDAMTPGYHVEFDPDEAERVGAFVEDALSEEEAAESGADLVDATVADADKEG